ncbi:MAG: ABC-F family ATP-binding cassette domain-containing protein [Leptolyngbyaceae cyanobacterium bins.349]|nr:ABC-F family ATP-binding cassette domain-containing protein [Leptolyngbyaceae cyanobacterium bins.349]
MTLFTLRSLRKDFGIKEILRDASFSLEEGDKVGLIGTNGSGKSTLLKMIGGLEPIDSGEIWVNSGAKIIYLPQQPELDESRTVLEQVFADSGEKLTLVRDYEELSEQLAHGQGDSEKLMAQLARVSQQIDTAGAWELESDAKTILSQLGIHDFDARIDGLSGGYRKRIAIATALLSEPDVLLMDEPTNHLDALSVEWLQSYLNRFRGALLLITHDRYFLDKVTNRILEIDRGDLFTYSGNYSYYLEKKAEAEDSAASTQRKHVGVLRRELEWLKRGPKARSTKQKARIDRIREMQGQEFKQTQGKVDISTVGRRIGKKVIELTGICKAYGDRVLIKDFTYLFNPEDRVGIIGSNGSGKSTLMNIITRRVEPDAGTVEIGSTIHIGYFDQHSEDVAMNENQRVIEYLKNVAELVKTSDGSVITASQMLERFLFPPDQQYAPIHKLSGGEKRRLFLLRVLMSAPNVLILDEPTNDLDVQTLAVLEDYLEDFNGCVIVVSHDRYFLDRTVETIFAFEPGGTLRQYAGNYTAYLDWQKMAEAEEKEKPEGKRSKGAKASAGKGTHELGSGAVQVDSRPNASAASLSPPASSLPPKKLSFKEKREYETLETRIPEMETEKAELEKQLYNNPSGDYEEMQQMTTRLAALTDAIEQATLRWMELAERMS